MTTIVEQQAAELNELRTYAANSSSTPEEIDDDIDSFIADFGFSDFS